MTSEQLEAARAERMRHNGNGALTLEDACTWLEETGLCLFLPKRQFSNSLAPSFVEAVAGQRNSTPDQKQIAIAEELLVRLEEKGVAVRLNLLGTPGEQPDYVVAAWVLPYVYALRGDRDWRRTPQLTGSRAVSPLAIQVYKRLESNGEATVAELKTALGQGLSEMGVLRAITELWQQLRIIPMVAAPGKAARWQLLRIRFQKAIAEGASTSQVTAISVLASIFLQAVIAASMEEVEIFLSPLTARSKIREVLRGLVATRQVHTLAMGHAPHFYVAGTLPEFSPAPTVYASTLGSAYLNQVREAEESYYEPAPAPVRHHEPAERHAASANGNGSTHGASHGTSHGSSSHGASSNGASRPHFARTANHSRDRKQAAPAPRRTSDSRPARSSNGRSAANGHSGGHSNGHSNGHSSGHWNGASKSGSGGSRSANGSHSSNGRTVAKGAKSNERPSSTSRNGKSAAPAWKSRNGNHAPAGKSAAGRTSGLSRSSSSSRAASSRPASSRPSSSRPASARKDSRPSSTARGNRKPGLTARTSGKRFGLAAKGSKKQG